MKQLNIIRTALVFSLVTNVISFYRLVHSNENEIVEIESSRSGAVSAPESHEIHQSSSGNSSPNITGATGPVVLNLNESGGASGISTYEYRNPRSEVCYVGRNGEGKSVYHGYGSESAVRTIITMVLSITGSSKGSVIEMQDEPLDWAKYGDCAD